MIRGSVLGGDESLFKKKRCSTSHGQVVRDTLEVLVKLPSRGRIEGDCRVDCTMIGHLTLRLNAA
jgi:hypothetical protein